MFTLKADEKYNKFAAKLATLNNYSEYLISNQFLMRKIRFSNFQNNEYDVMIERDVIFHATSGANDVIKVDRSARGVSIVTIIII